MLFFVGYIFPYVAAAIFILGIAHKLRRWMAVPLPFHLTAFPVPNNAFGRLLVFLKELLLFNSLFRHNRILWLLSWTMHLSLGLIIVGHILGIYFFREQFTLLGLSKGESRALSHLLGMMSGGAFILSLLALLARRFFDTEARATSDLSSYVELGLLAGIALAGIGLRFDMSRQEFLLIREYMAGLILFRPAAMPGSPWFFWHFFLVNILVMYLPFSRLVHGLGGGITRIMLTESPPIYPTAPGKTPRSTFTGTARNKQYS